MKVFVVVACVALIATVGANPHRGKHGEKYREAIEQCKESTNVSDDLIEKIKNHENFDDPKGFCFEKCMCSKKEACDAEFKLVADKFLEYHRVSAEKLNPAIEKCNTFTGADDCETVHKRLHCLYETVPEVRRRPSPHDPHGDGGEKFALIRETFQQCKESTNPSDEVLEKIRNQEDIEDPKGWCFEKCMCSKIGACDAEFKLVAEKFMKYHRVSEEKVRSLLAGDVKKLFLAFVKQWQLNPAIEKCNALTGADDCETVHKRFKCLFDEVPEARWKPHRHGNCEEKHKKKFADTLKFIEQCKEITNVPQDVVDKIKTHENFDDPKGFCFQKCMCTKMEACDAEHKLVAEKFLENGRVSAEKLNPAIQKCNALTGADDCETVHNRFKCLFEDVPEARWKPHKHHEGQKEQETSAVAEETH